MSYIAHRREENGDFIEQSMTEHLEGTAKLCREFAKGMQLEEIAYKTALLHDIGKYSTDFQNRIRGGKNKVDHSTAGTREAMKCKAISAAFAISGHHGGMPDRGGRTDGPNDGTLFSKIHKDKFVADYSVWKYEQPDFKLDFRSDPVSKRELPEVDRVFLIRMLFSCLVDADFLDTEKFMSGGREREKRGEDLQIILDRLNEKIKDWQNPQGELNILRTQMLNECIHMGKTSKNNLFTLTVPTGGGKTISSLEFALNYALENGKKRIIYVVPYTSIIEQNAEVFSKYIGYKNVLEHHSNIDYDKVKKKLGDDEEISKAMLACENWDSPIIVTTAVQFFESLFSNKPGACRKLHNICESVIIFDEAQMLPTQYLTPCIHAIYELTKYCSAAAVLCTATQPSLEKFFQKYSGDNTMKIEEICKGSLVLTDKFRRVRFSYDGKLDNYELSERLKECRQVLCIVNTKKHAKELFDLIGDESGNFHLSTNMYPQHRKKVLEEIRQRLGTGKSCRVISTSLIEAGVDVDFPEVYRAVSGIDSIMQAGGRCNREGKRDFEKSVVHIFDTDEVGKYQEVNISVSRDILKKYGDEIYRPEVIEEYFNRLHRYQDMENTGNSFDIKGIMGLTKEFSFSTISDKFKIIANDTAAVYIPTAENEKYIEQLRSGYYSAEMFRELQKYTVNVYSNNLQSLYDSSKLEIIDKKFCVLADPESYNEKTGLDFSNLQLGIGIFI